MLKKDFLMGGSLSGAYEKIIPVISYNERESLPLVKHN